MWNGAPRGGRARKLCCATHSASSLLLPLGLGSPVLPWEWHVAAPHPPSLSISAGWHLCQSSKPAPGLRICPRSPNLPQGSKPAQGLQTCPRTANLSHSSKSVPQLQTCSRAPNLPQGSKYPPGPETCPSSPSLLLPSSFCVSVRDYQVHFGCFFQADHHEQCTSSSPAFSSLSQLENRDCAEGNKSKIPPTPPEEQNCI